MSSCVPGWADLGAEIEETSPDSESSRFRIYIMDAVVMWLRTQVYETPRLTHGCLAYLVDSSWERVVCNQPWLAHEVFMIYFLE